MKKIIVLLFALMSCIAVFAGNSKAWGKINYQDSNPNDMQLLLKLTCSDPYSCYAGIGSNAGPAEYDGWIKIHSLKIQDNNWNKRDITSYVPSNCLMITAPQDLNIIVDRSGKVTSITCPKNK